MKRMVMRTKGIGGSGCRAAIAWCLLAAGLAVAVPSVAQDQNFEQIPNVEQTGATEQLFEAVHANDFPAVQASVAAGADVEASDRWGMTPMELAIDKGYFEIGHYLVAVRNFNRSNTDERPAVTAPARSPFGSPASGEVASGTPAPSSPLGPLSQPAGNGRSGVSENDVDIETSAGPGSGSQEWPADKANPFDPNVPAHGTGAYSSGKVGKTAPDSFTGGGG